MSLPEKYTDSKVYLSDCVAFLRDYSWLYNYPNTHLLIEDVFNNIDKTWLPVFTNLTNYELNQLPFGYINESWPDSFKYFLARIESLKPKIETLKCEEIEDISQDFFKGLSVKKKHEILSMSPLIHKNCEGVDLIVDIGAGLGYLPQILYEKYRFKVLGIEADPNKVESARNRQKKLYPDSENHVKYFQLFVDENSASKVNEFIFEFMKIEPQKLNICLIGLHACADLTITMLRLFFEMTNIKNTIVMPCCYHRMKKIDDLPEKFINFPVSNILRNVFDEFDGEKFLKSTFLRLSCQNSSSTWRKMTPLAHMTHSINLLRRNILQLVVEKEGYHLSRLKRKSKTADNTISCYVNNLIYTHKLIDKNTNENIPITIISDKLEQAWYENEGNLNLFEVYIGLQTSIQQICENLILVDRVFLIREMELDGAAIKVSNEELSPRCFAVVAKRQQT